MRRQRHLRAIARASHAGFTLIELMVVVVLVSILAVLAIPNMAAARQDRLAFRTADQFARLIHEAQTRSLGRGAAQLVLISSNGVGDRGTIRTFEALDAKGTPVSACKNSGEWGAAPAGTTLPCTTAPCNPMIGVSDLNTGAGSLQVVSGLETTLTVGGAADKFGAICFTPGGRVYATHAATAGGAIAALESAPTFTSDVLFEVFRKPGGGTAEGLTRQVIMTSNGGVRVHSK